MDEITIITDETKILFAKLELAAEPRVSQDGEIFAVDIETQDSGILIGYHGETLAALQLILSLVVSKKIGRFVRLVLNVGDYRQRREEKLKEMALSAARRAKETKQEVILGNLSSWQRRVVHITLADDAEVTTESQGEEPQRQLVIKPQ